MEEKQYMEIIDENDNVIKYEIIMAFKLEPTGKFYIVYTDNSHDEQGNLNIYASIYFPQDDTRLEKIESEEEWQIIESKIRTLSLNNGNINLYQS